MHNEIIRNIKQQFYVYRNGMLGEQLRNCGDAHKIIFGLNLPQIVAIANNIEKSVDLSMEMWNNVSVRESQLLAPMIFPIEELSINHAKVFIESVPNMEVADILCHRLLRHAPFATDLYTSYIDSNSDLERYTAMRIAMNLLAMKKIENIDKLKEKATIEKNKNCKSTITLASLILDEIEFS